MKQTAVEWLIENLITEPYSEKDFEHNKNCWDKAEEMEKAQIMDATYYGHLKGWVDDGVENSYAEQYYNETYKK
jgi:hypothetical protein